MTNALSAAPNGAVFYSYTQNIPRVRDVLSADSSEENYPRLERMRGPGLRRDTM